MEGYPGGRPIPSDAPVRPRNIYEASKCFAEAVAAQLALGEGLSSIAIRIGAYDPQYDGYAIYRATREGP